MYLEKLGEAYAARFKDFSYSSNKDEVNRDLNLAYKEVFRAHDWEYRKKTGELLLVPKYTTGTCTITQYNGTNYGTACTVTFSGSTLDSGMVGRYFKPDGSSTWYRIMRVDSDNSQVILETPIVDDSASGLSFEIWKRFYYLYSEVDVVLSVGKWGGSGSVEFENSNTLLARTNNISSDGAPYVFTPNGADPFETAYSTGTIEISKDSNLVVGTNTGWIGVVWPGDRLTVNSNIYHVKRVESDTRIILYNYVESAIASSSYTIEKENTIALQFLYNTDSYRVIPYTYLSHAYDMVHPTKDRPLLPDEFDEAIITRAESIRKRNVSDSGWVAITQLYQGILDGLKAKRSVVNPPYRQFAPRIHPNMPGRR